MKTERRIKYKHLSWQLKVAVIGGFGFAIYFVAVFTFGFIMGLWGYY